MTFQKEEFTNYLFSKGNNQPGTYCNSLNRIENILSVNIDNEYETDKCQSLYDKLQWYRKNDPTKIAKDEHIVRTFASHLKKYTEFKNTLSIENLNINIDESIDFSWTNYYIEFADKLLTFYDKRNVLIKLIKSIYDEINIKLPTLEKSGHEIIDIDPFTIFALFNKGITDANRIKIMKAFKTKLDMKSDVPSEFNGVPVVNNLNATFYFFIDDRNEDDIENLWQLFINAIKYADLPNEDLKVKFIHYYDTVLSQKGSSWKITIGLFWIRPFNYINLDSRMREGFRKVNIIPPVDYPIIQLIKKVPSGKDYLKIIELCFNAFKTYNYNFPLISYKAWINDTQNDNDGYWPSLDEFDPNISKDEWKKYILEMEMQHISVMKMLKALMEMGGEGSCKELADKYGGNPSAYVGCTVNLGRRAKKYFNIESIIDDERNRLYIIPFQGKTINQYYSYKIRTELYDALQEIDLSSISPYYESSDEDIVFAKYSKEDFLDEVFMNKNDYEILKNVLLRKKNIILQGAPGVGKTFSAKRLVYSIIGEKNKEYLSFVQFHQNYTYEDFIMGFKPNTDGSFKLESGIFYDFVMKAKEDLEHDYFFIIDEINRGNLSKIFGELLMTIEADHRDEPVLLAYNHEMFSIPENIHIIGMMNTADRSIALIDYALRRRFSFFEMKPGFETIGFKKYQTKLNNIMFDSLITKIKELNKFIIEDESLGEGFIIGHSYFCNQTTISKNWIKEVVEFDILPTLKEYWFDNKQTLNQWEDELRKVYE